MSKIEEVKVLKLTIKDNKINMTQKNLSFIEVLGVLELANVQVNEYINESNNNDKDE
tara:strand:+ start:272 stop:442 length:171 start_codon:yes stop_codon:yes gene_type:complete